jgi:dephospho-CoA kinase
MMATDSNYKALQVGLTGSIGMGKSTVAKQFKRLGFPVFDADATVHQLYGPGGAAVGPIGELFPDAIVDNAVCRPVLGEKVLGNPVALKSVEAIVHPMVISERKAFFEKACEEGHLMVIYDIPLLLENPSAQQVEFGLIYVYMY